MGAALSYKRGENKHPSQEVKHVADSMTETQLEDMAKSRLRQRNGNRRFISFGIPWCRSAGRLPVGARYFMDRWLQLPRLLYLQWPHLWRLLLLRFLLILL